MSKHNIEYILPLSPAQQGILFHTLYAPQSGVYLVQFNWTFQGALDEPLFQQAWQQVADRHAALRTLYTWERQDKPLQIIRQRVALPWQSLDWRGLPAEQRQGRLEAFVQEDRVRDFDLSQTPVMRLALIRVADETYHFVWSFHHLVIDGWSVAQVLKEVFAIYEALCRGQEPQLEASRPYRDYITWLQRQDLSKAEAFWRSSLAGITSPTPLYGDTPNRAGAKHTHRSVQELLPAAATAELQSFARRNGLTLNTLIQGAWALLLGRSSDARDVVFGTAVSGRPAGLAGVDTMVGMFINTLPVRVRLRPQDTLLDWLKRLQQHQAELLQYEYSPLADIQGWSEVPRGAPLFESLLVFGNYPLDPSVFTGGVSLQVRDVQVHESTSYPLTVDIDIGPELSLKITYDSVRFVDGAMERMVRHLATLLTAMPASPSARLADLPLLTDDERRQLLQSWNASELAFPRESYIDQFEAQVERTPDATAAVCCDVRLTYRELNTWANRLAWQLRARGVGPEALVALLAERGVPLLASVLAVFKVGGAYLPLDPRHPPARHAQICGQSDIALILSSAPFVEMLEQAAGLLPPGAPAAPVLILEDHMPQSGQDANPARWYAPSQLAYVIYTSGSTGAPRGAMVEQLGMLNHLYAKIHDLSLTSADRVAQTASQCFDISVWQMLIALILGGQVHILPDSVAHVPPALVQAIVDEQLTIVELVPSLLKVLAEDLADQGDDRPALAHLRWMIPTGEALPAELAALWLELYPAIPLLNAYGPTECSDDVSHAVIARPPAERHVPIGRPVANMRLYVVDGQLSLVPVGVLGELLVGGIGVGRGYLRNQARTADVFVPDPFGGEPGARLYRTGDIARWRPDGQIEYLGRRDQQVKVRGYRIELGEIEAVVRQHSAVKDVCVLVHTTGAGSTQLVAYLVWESGAAEDRDGLQTFVQERLPEYMVPGVLITLAALPLNPNGKVDRRALPAPEEAIAAATPYAAPQTPVEQTLAQIWGGLLNTERVGIHDNFFDLGGHSLLITQLASRIRKAFQVEVPVGTLFDHPTIAEMTRAIADIQAAQAGDPEELLQMLAELKQMSPEHVRALLAQEQALS